MANILKNQKFLCALGGAAAVILGKQILTAKKTRELAVSGLAKGMKLQIDATVVYAWRLKGRKVTRVLNSDLTVQSPYNTYNITGLPPHPICIPGLAAWAAAIDPEKNDYYYYVAGKNGYHYFAKTYSEHLRNIKKARAEK